MAQDKEQELAEELSRSEAGKGVLALFDKVIMEQQDAFAAYLDEVKGGTVSVPQEGWQIHTSIPLVSGRWWAYGVGGRGVGLLLNLSRTLTTEQGQFPRKRGGSELLMDLPRTLTTEQG